MPDNGVRTIDLASLTTAEDLLVHHDGTLGVLPRETLALLLAASGALADRLAELDRATSYASVLRPTWTALAALAPEAIGQQAEVSPDDTGSHTDPQTSATVDNAGRYTAFGTSAGQWTWVDSSGLASKLSIAANLSDVANPAIALTNLGAASQAAMEAAEAAIVTKADAADVTMALGLKANADDVTVALELKANAADLGTAASAAATDFATAEQGAAADTAVQPDAASFTGDVVLEDTATFSSDVGDGESAFKLVDADGNPALVVTQDGRVFVDRVYARKINNAQFDEDIFDDSNALAITDADGNAALVLSHFGELFVEALRARKVGIASGELVDGDSDGFLSFALQDDEGNICLSISSDGKKLYVEELVATRVTTDEISTPAFGAKSYTGNIVNDVDMADFLIFPSNGQSLSRSTVGFDTLTAEDRSNVFAFVTDFDTVAAEMRTPTSFGIDVSQNQGAPGPAKDLANVPDAYLVGAGLVFGTALQVSYLADGDPAFPQAPRIIIASHGTNGSNIAQIEKGGERDAYADGQYQVSEAVRLAGQGSSPNLAGIGPATVQVPFTIYCSGESDGGADTDPTVLQNSLLRLLADQRGDYTAGDTGVVTDTAEPRASSTNPDPVETSRSYDFLGSGQKDQSFPMLIYQPSSDSSPSTFTPGGSYVPFIYYKLARDNPADVMLFAPYYQFPGRDNVHLHQDGYNLASAQCGKVAWRLLRGETWTPLMPRSVEARTRRIILCRFHVPYGPLVLDTTHILCTSSGVGVDPYQSTSGASGALSLGFEVYDPTKGGYLAFAKAPEVVGAKQDTVRIVLDEDIQDASPWLLYAGPGNFPNGHKNGAGPTPEPSHDVQDNAPSSEGFGYASPPIDNGPRGCLRDSDFTRSLFSERYPNGTPKPLYNWCVHFAEQIVT